MSSCCVPEEGPGHEEPSVEPPPRAPLPPPAPPPALGAPEAFASAAGCERILAARAPAPPRATTRVGSWNLRWFPHGHMPGRGSGAGSDLGWIACAVAHLRLDALAVQEIVLDARGREALPRLLGALDARTGGDWQIELDPCPRDGRQHVGVLYDATRLRKREVRLYPELNPAGGACATRLRPGLSVSFLALASPSGARSTEPFEVLSVHLDSGTSPRDHGHRQEGYRLLAARLGAPGARLLVAGDLNLMGCEGCAPPVRVEAEEEALRARCRERGVVPTPLGGPCTELSRYGARALDRILLSPSLSPALRGGRVEVSGFCASVGCAPAARRSEAYHRLSDHCPLIAELSL